MEGLVGFLPFILLIAVFYFLLIRPQQKRAQQHKQLLSEVQAGDEVVTIGGIFGDVVDIDDDRVLLELYDGSQVEFRRSAVSQRVVSDAEKTPTSDEIDLSSPDETADETVDETVEETADEEVGDKSGSKSEASKARKD